MIWFRRKSRGVVSSHPEVRNSLFGDESLASCAEVVPDDPDTPWARLHAARAAQQVGDVRQAVSQLRGLLELPEIETRLRLQAWSCLRELGEVPSAGVGPVERGVVVESAGPDGLLTLAVYEDMTACLVEPSGLCVDWVTPDETVQHHVRRILQLAQVVLDRTHPVQGPREPAPEPGHASITVLTYAGPHSGSDEVARLEADAMGGPLLREAAMLRRELAARKQLR
ncbi:MAG: hypothetical protein RL148_1300 [Planctomycetota bacterium]|jgi:hypothetical protein